MERSEGVNILACLHKTASVEPIQSSSVCFIEKPSFKILLLLMGKNSSPIGDIFPTTTFLLWLPLGRFNDIGCFKKVNTGSKKGAGSQIEQSVIDRLEGVPSPLPKWPMVGNFRGPNGSIMGGGYPLQRVFPSGGPIRNLAGTPMGQLGGGVMVAIEEGGNVLGVEQEENLWGFKPKYFSVFSACDNL